MQICLVQRHSVATKHPKNIFQSCELNEISVSAKIAHTAPDGKKYQTLFYNLDAIISVGYWVISVQATHFRIFTKSLNNLRSNKQNPSYYSMKQ